MSRTPSSRAQPDPHKTAVLILATIIEMSDHAKAMGGATSISGVAALHRMQTSIQKNRSRIIAMCKLDQVPA
jgi:hypothetical protein